MIYRDIKPDNFLSGKGAQKQNQIFMVSFGVDVVIVGGGAIHVVGMLLLFMWGVTGGVVIYVGGCGMDVVFQFHHL